MLTIERIRVFLMSGCQVAPTDKLLVGVSGGADSMALLHALLEMGMTVEAAHVNYRLRGVESDGDETLVVDYCRQKGVRLHQIGFDTHEVARSQKKSIEMAARELRYGWFSKLMDDRGLSAVAVGHHLNDSIETFFINLIRGTGIHGVTGIKPRHGRVVRPFLRFTRGEVQDYCHRHHIPWRTDSSNLGDDYLRNRIRHHLIPVFESLHPAFLQTMGQNMGRLAQAESFLADTIAQLKPDIMAEVDGTTLIPVKLLKDHPYKELMLFELLNGKGFSPAQINDIVEALDGIAGKQFFSPAYRLVRDRDNLVLLPIEGESRIDEVGYVENGQQLFDGGVKLAFRQLTVTDGFEFSRDPFCVHIDADKIDFPLAVRKWRQGDVFVPLGMTGFKKLSDFFIDNKLNLVEKERVWLLFSGEEVVWVIGRRLDNRFKITSKTKKILEVRWEVC
ncbi:MAG: tRNA lysidine(34) synthetase TilS [Breznakibacter sp.]